MEIRTANTPKDLGRDAEAALIREAADALDRFVGAVPALGSGRPPISRALRRFLGTLGTALAAGVPAPALLAALARDPDEDVPPPPPPPWEQFLPLTLSAFAQTAAALRVRIRAWGPLGETIWLCDSSELAEALVAAGAWNLSIKGRSWWESELKEAGIPEADWTLGRLVETLKAEIQDIRHLPGGQR